MSGISKQVLAGSIWMVGMQWVIKLLGIVSTIILARLLLPSDYGIVAMASLVVSLLQTITETGIAPYLIRKSDIVRKDYDTAWTLKLFIYIFLGLILFFFAEYFAGFFNNQLLTDVFKVLAANVAISGFLNIGLIALQKKLEYGRIFLHGVIVKISGFIVTVYFAYLLKNYWAMVYGTLATTIVSVLFSYVVSRYIPKLTVSGFRQQWAFSKWYLIKNFSGYARMKTDQIVVGKFLGVEMMGRYTMSLELADLPASEVIYPALAPVYAGYAKLLNEPDKLDNAFITVVGLVSVIALPMFMGLMVIAEEFIPLMLGEKWLSIIPLFQSALILVMTQLYTYVLSNYLTVVGKIKLLSLMDWGMVICLIPVLIYLSLNYNAIYVVFGRAFLALCVMPFFLIYIKKFNKLSLLRVFMVIIRPLAVTLIMGAVVCYVAQFLPKDMMVALIIKITTGIFTYSILLLALWWITGMREGGERFIYGNLKAYVSRI
ncbi:MAG: lipopolysaccharide biosynthesis protein [Methylovulum sp.]|nr:lipopolysaccharide biosynthesis protein [Methylovulum sp.]